MGLAAGIRINARNVAARVDSDRRGEDSAGKNPANARVPFKREALRWPEDACDWG